MKRGVARNVQHPLNLLEEHRPHIHDEDHQVQETAVSKAPVGPFELADQFPILGQQEFGPQAFSEPPEGQCQSHGQDHPRTVGEQRLSPGNIHHSPDKEIQQKCHPQEIMDDSHLPVYVSFHNYTAKKRKTDDRQGAGQHKWQTAFHDFHPNSFPMIFL